MSEAISKVSTIADGSMEITPTIRPVLDLTDVTQGLGQIDNGLAASRSMNLGMDIARNQNGNTSGISDLVSELANTNMQSNSRLANAIEGLQSDFTDLVDKVGQLQVVMDTGVLVGAISPDMDKNLGHMAVMSRRGV